MKEEKEFKKPITEVIEEWQLKWFGQAYKKTEKNNEHESKILKRKRDFVTDQVNYKELRRGNFCSRCHFQDKIPTGKVILK